MKRLALAAALLVLAALPFWVGNTFYVNIATQILLYAVFALGDQRAGGLCAGW